MTDAVYSTESWRQFFKSWRRLKKSPSRFKKSTEKLDNRYTDVVSLQRKFHESQTLYLQVLTLKNDKIMAKDVTYSVSPRINPRDKEAVHSFCKMIFYYIRNHKSPSALLCSISLTALYLFNSIAALLAAHANIDKSSTKPVGMKSGNRSMGVTT